MVCGFAMPLILKLKNKQIEITSIEMFHFILKIHKNNDLFFILW